MNKQKTFRVALAVAVAAGLCIPLLSQVKSSHFAANAAPLNPVAGNAQVPVAPQPPATRPAVDPNTVIAKFGNTTLTAAEFFSIIDQAGPQASQIWNQPSSMKQVAQNLLQLKVLAEEARKLKIDEKPEVKLQVDKVLAQSLAQDTAAKSDDRAFFDANKSMFDKMKARHILIRTPDSPVPIAAGKTSLSDAQALAKAQDIKNRLDKEHGANFSDLAKVESDDTGSGIKGGDLGEFSAWSMDPTFAKAAQSLQPNQISAPVKTQFGYHIIQLLEDKPQSFEQAKADIHQVRLQNLVINMQKETTYSPAFFGAAGTHDTGPTTQPAPASGRLPAGGPAKVRGAS